ncbi:MAG: molecular chaperone DnaK [Deltaproteobacteria bacterium]|nr:molecular chaperone DnaK [Deltaproteobacteria bacterium]
MERVIGIDLGTTNSCVAVIEGGTPVVVANRGGYKTTPSMVAVAESGRRLIGHVAKRQAITNAENTVYAAKRLIGRKWAHHTVAEAQETLPYAVVEGEHGDVRIKLRDKDYAIPEVSAMVLTEMKRVAEEHFGGAVDKVVITIPAYFNDGQRQATKDAGRIAGLDVIRIINEPTAAALAYGYKKHVNKRVAIFDLGGGTFDISILDIGEGVFEVLATAGDTYLGGEDFDRRVVNWLVEKFKATHNVDLLADPMSAQRLRDAAEKAKIELSMTEQAEINLPFIISTGKNDGLHLQETITRAQLEELTADLVNRTIEICARTLDEANIGKSELDDIIMVGGQTRMPNVQQGVRDYFACELNKTVHPDEVVALGAAVQAHALVSSQKDEPELLLLDVTPHNLGIMIAGAYFQCLIKANSTVPTSASHIFTTVRDDQTAVKIVVLQGSSGVASENELLGEFVLTGLRKAHRGEVEIDVIFDISSDGIVSVSARDRETGKEQSIQVTANNQLSEAEMNRIFNDNADYAVAEKNVEALGKLKNLAEKYLRDIQKLLPTVREIISMSEFGSDALTKAEGILKSAREAIDKDDVETLKTLVEPLERTSTMFKGLAAKQGK